MIDLAKNSNYIIKAYKHIFDSKTKGVKANEGI